MTTKSLSFYQKLESENGLNEALFIIFLMESFDKTTKTLLFFGEKDTFLQVFQDRRHYNLCISFVLIDYGSLTVALFFPYFPCPRSIYIAKGTA